MAMLAKEFARRANFFARMYFESEGEGFAYDEDAIASCGEDHDFLEWLLANSDNDVIWDKGREIMHTSPTQG